MTDELNTLDILEMIKKAIKLQKKSHKGTRGIIAAACRLVAAENPELDAEYLERLYRRHASGVKHLGGNVNYKGLEVAGTPFVTMEMPVEMDYLENIYQMRRMLYEAAGATITMRRALNAVLKSANIDRPEIERLNGVAAGLRAQIIQLFPYGLCPFCKGMQGVQEFCIPCGQLGWVNKEVFESADSVLKETNGYVFFNGIVEDAHVVAEWTVGGSETIHVVPLKENHES